MIIVFCGNISGGKSTGAKYIAGLVLRHVGLIKSFKIVDQDLLVTANVSYDKIIEQEFPMDLKCREYDFFKYACHKIYPHVKIYSYADNLKESIARLFSIDINDLYGSNEQKNKSSKILWDNLIKLLPSHLKKGLNDKKGTYVTYRELMQYFGTEICRTLYNDCHVESCFKQVIQEGSEIALIDDCRFPNEVEYAKKQGAKLIKLDRKVESSTHDSETLLSTVPDDQFDYIIPECTLEEKHEHINKALHQLGLSYLV